MKPAPTCRRHGWVAGGRAHDFVFAGKTDISEHWVPACAGVAVGCGNFMFPLISAHFRALSPFRRGQAVSWGPGTGTWLGGCRPGGGFIFCGHNRTFSGGGLVPGCAGVAVWCGNFMFPLIPAHFRALPPVRWGEAVRWGPGTGRVSNLPLHARDTVGRLAALGPDLIFAGKTGHSRVWGSRLRGSGGLVRKFHVPAHFRSFPSVGSGQAGAGCSLRPGMGTGLKPATTCRGHGWVAVGPGAEFWLLRA